MNKKQRLDYLQEQLLEASYLVFDGFINDYDDYEEYSEQTISSSTQSTTIGVKK